MSLNSVWERALVYIETKVSKQVFETWFTPTRLKGIENSSAQIEVPNKFFGQWLMEHHKG
ncbi:MAG: DnaA N-terminal domain-containing protein, partial [Nitrospira sp.]